MFTVCPKCTLTLAVTAADLRVGQGYVRCGRCANVFNALLTLSEEPADALAVPAVPQITPEAAPQAAASQAAAPSPPALSSQQTTGHASAASGPEMHLPTEQSSDGAIENESNQADGTGTFETIVLEGDAITQTEEFVPEASVDSEIAALTQRLGMAANEPVVSPLSARARALRDSEAETFSFELDATSADAADFDAADGRDQDNAEANATDAADSGDAPELDLSAFGTAPARHRWPWAVGGALLSLLLALQAVHHWRDDLAASPFWNAPLNHAYAAIGVPLDPHWNLAAYDVRQQGATTDPDDANVIRVRLSLANHAPRAQPPPVLRLTLLDRYGKRIAARDLTSAEYWPRGNAPAFLQHDQRIDSEIAVRDPSANSSSFELDVCLKNSGGALRCAGDSAASATGAAAAP